MSIDSLARHAGVTRPVVAKHFLTTADIVTELLDREHRRMFDGPLSETNQVMVDASTIDSVTALCNCVLTAIDETPAIWQVVYHLTAYSHLHDRLRVPTFEAALTTLLIAAIDRTGPTDDIPDPEMLAHHLFAALWGAGALLLYRDDELPPARIASSLHRMVERLIAPPVDQ